MTLRTTNTVVANDGVALLFTLSGGAILFGGHERSRFT
jgi:hypothetical protein